MTKSSREIMEILEAFDLTRCAWSAAEPAGCDAKTVARYVAVRDAPSFTELVLACQTVTAVLNARVHRETSRAPVDMLAEERTRLHVLPTEATRPGQFRRSALHKVPQSPIQPGAR